MCVEENSWIPVEQVSLQGEFRDERYIDALKGGVKGGGGVSLPSPRGDLIGLVRKNNNNSRVQIIQFVVGN